MNHSFALFESLVAQSSFTDAKMILPSWIHVSSINWSNSSQDLYVSNIYLCSTMLFYGLIMTRCNPLLSLSFGSILTGTSSIVIIAIFVLSNPDDFAYNQTSSWCSAHAYKSGSFLYFSNSNLNNLSACIYSGLFFTNS